MSELHISVPDHVLDEIAERVAERLGVTASAEPWVGVPQAARHLGCQPQRIYNLVHERAIPHRKDGSRLLFRLGELDRWLDGR